MGCSVFAGLLACGTVVFGFERIQALGWGRGWGGPFVQPVQHAPTEQTQDGFVVSASGTALQDTPAGAAIEFIKEGQWVKAIQAIESLSDADQGLVLDERGVLRPLSTMKSVLIASMPEEGRRIFCKLNDPAANTKLANALGSDDLDQRASAFKSILDGYVLCDAAAAAARHLGDIRFEQGRFSEAALVYRFAADHPATTADDPELMARRLTALSRADQWKAFDALAEYTAFRHADTTVKIAGQDTALPALIAELVASRDQSPAPEPTGAASTIAMPVDADLEYDRPLINEDNRKLLNQLAMNHNMNSIVDQVVNPVVATDGQRLFTLALGRVARLDPETGTELWHLGDTEKGISALQSRMHYLTRGYHQSLVVHGQTLLASVPNEKTFYTSRLIALDAESGEEKWDLYDVLRRNSESCVGLPLVIDDMVYFITYRSTQDLTLRSVRLADGSEVGKLALGKASKGPNLNAPAELSPRLAMGQSHLMVQTNNGALIAVDLGTMKIAWAYSQKIRPSGMNLMRRHGSAVVNAIARHTGNVVSIDDIVITKDTRTKQVVAFREYDAALVWTAESDADATIVHHDEQHIYVLGEELVALDRLTGERIWWTPHPGDKSGQPVFTDDACLIAGNHRLCRVDLVTGKLTHYREDLISPNALHVIGDQLVSVGQRRITAIRLP